jgi:hypothetical protein
LARLTAPVGPPERTLLARLTAPVGPPERTLLARLTSARLTAGREAVRLS